MKGRRAEETAGRGEGGGRAGGASGHTAARAQAGHRRANLVERLGIFEVPHQGHQISIQTEIQRLDSVEVKSRSGNQARVILKYLWMNDNDSQRVGRGEATVRSIGGRTEVTDFKSIFPTPSQLLRADAGASGL
jgi:hypothetical protein